MKVSPAVQQRIRVILASASCIAVALALVLLLGGWGAFQDSERLRLAIIQAEITLVRSHAARTAGRIESELAHTEDAHGLYGIAHADWIRDRWKVTVPPPDRLYAAIVNSSGLVVAHSDPQREGEFVRREAADVEVAGVGPGVFETTCPALSGGERAVDVVVPIGADGKQIATYHAGISHAWLQRLAIEGRQKSLQRWGIVIGGILTVVLASSVFLYRITRRAAVLENALALAHSRRTAELGQLMAGLAHEIRNPLHAVRLNLFTADRVFRGDASLDPDEMAVMLGESVREIERVDELIDLLLGYARPERANTELVDLPREIDAVMRFLRPSFQSGKIEVEVAVPSESVFVAAGRGDVRQILLNLLGNACDAVAEQEGKIEVALRERSDTVEVTVRDNGSGIAADNRERIFQPFFTTKESGAGLGLAVVRSLVEAAGGGISFENTASGGCCFYVRWPVPKGASGREEIPVA